MKCKHNYIKPKGWVAYSPDKKIDKRNIRVCSKCGDMLPKEIVKYINIVYL